MLSKSPIINKASARLNKNISVDISILISKQKDKINKTFIVFISTPV
ncbi:MAG: hypothetical protein QW478_06485 [Candidatus Micrarchaeaceae archaeon]